MPRWWRVNSSSCSRRTANESHGISQIVGIQVESVEAVTNVRRLVRLGIGVVTFGPNDLRFSLEGHPSYPLQTVDDCMRNIFAQLQGTGVRMAMRTATKPSARDT